MFFFRQTLVSIGTNLALNDLSVLDLHRKYTKYQEMINSIVFDFQLS